MLAAATRPYEDIPDPSQDGGDAAELGFQKPGSIYDREDEYRRRRLQRVISPDRNDAFAMGDKTPDARVRSYADIMREQQLQRETENTMRNIHDKKRMEADAAAAMATSATAAQKSVAAAQAAGGAAAAAAVGEKRKKRWDSTEPTGVE
eukprot:1155956-Pelagomonas_calceolata.AAC.8